MDSSHELSSSQESSKRKRKRTNLTTGKKFRRHLSADTIEDSSAATSFSSSQESSTQVTPLKVKASGNQTLLASTCTSSTSTADSISEHISVQTIEDNLLSQCEKLPLTMKELISNGTFSQLCETLSEKGQLNDFSHLLESIADGKVPAENLCWLLNIHLGKLMSLGSTTQMRWHKDLIEFFSIVYILFGASAINVLRGPMHFSDLVMENVEKGKFDPAYAKMNLPIPSINTLRNLSTGYPKEIPVGLIQHSLDIAEEESTKGCQYILSFDGKLVAKGFKGERYGDIDLWGIEKPISLDSALKLLHRNLASADALRRKITHTSLFSHIVNLQSLLYQTSRRIMTLRKRISGEHYLRLKIVKMVHNKALDRKQRYSYQMQLSFLNEHSARCDSQIGRSLSLNSKITKCLALCRENIDVYSSQPVVNLQNQNNAFFLFPPERNSQYFDLTLRENSDIVKQRSAVWFELRKRAKVTGSTMHNALGLSSLTDLRQHHYQFVKKRSSPPFPEEVKKRMTYGSENEKNVIATVVGNLLPSLLPRCFAFQEVGSVFLDVAGEENFLEVSADGILMCFRGEECPEKNSVEDHKLIPLEAKCIFPDSSKPIEPMYQMYACYVPQTLAEMAAYKCNSLWLVNFAVTSVVLLQVRFNVDLWEKMCRVCIDLHGGEKPKVPVKLHPLTKTLKADVAKFITTHCSFICEVPVVFGVETALRESTIISPYSFCEVRQKQTIEKEIVERESKLISLEAKPLFNEIHNTLRQEAQEVLVFMLSDHNRHHQEFVPYSLPLGYAMKGKNMANKDVRFLVEKCRETLKERNIPVLCEVYDGQWQNICMTSNDGEPLTELRVIKPTWQRVEKMSKEKCLQEMLLACKVSRRDLEEMATDVKLLHGKKHYHNLTLVRNADATVDVESTGGLTFKQPAMKYIRSVTKSSRPDLWREDAQQHREEISEEPPQIKRKGKACGLTESEKSIVHLLDSEIVHDLQESIGENIFGDEVMENRQNVTNIDYEKELLRLALNRADISLLQDIIEDLKELNVDKWRTLTADDLYPRILTDPKCITTSFTAAEIMCIGKTLEQRTRRKFCRANVQKASNANAIADAFLGDNFLEVKTKSTNRRTTVQSLQLIAKNAILKDDYKLVLLQVSLANAIHREKRDAWFTKSPIEMFGFIPRTSGENSVIKYFSYPEFSLKRQQVEHRTLDYTHILTNMKSHILNKGYDFCQKEHFQTLAKEDPNLLSRPLVFDNIDQQNAYSAQLMFSEDVQKFMEKKGYTETANFIRLVRHWHAACDSRGLRADVRVELLFEMYSFLTEETNFNSFPFIYTGRYWKGMPIQMYEALLQSICTRIQLYSYAHNKSYNSRAISTLANESFFSDMVRMDKESRSYPKACNIPKIFGRVVTLNYYKHLPEKNWFLTATHKGTYPEHLAECHTEDLKNQDGFYVNHFFDFPDQRDSQRCRRYDISRGTQPLRFSGGVRKFYRGDESRILPEDRAGLEPKPLPFYDKQSGKIDYNK